MLKTLLIASLILCACHKKTELNQPSIINDLLGTWNSMCVVNNKSNGSSMQTYKFLGNTNTRGSFLSEQKYFSDPNCKNLANTKNDEGFYIIGLSDAPSKPKNIDFQITRQTITPNSDDFVRTLNSKAYCGNTWVKNKVADITEKNNCGDPALITGKFNVYLVNGTFLSFGDTNDDPNKDGSSSAKRPSAPSLNIYKKN